MKEREKIAVWIKTERGKTKCICIKGCDRMEKCESDIVERDRFRGWRQTMVRNKYGK